MQEGQENDNVTALIPQKHHDDAQDSDSEDLDAGVNLEDVSIWSSDCSCDPPIGISLHQSVMLHD